MNRQSTENKSTALESPDLEFKVTIAEGKGWDIIFYDGAYTLRKNTETSSQHFYIGSTKEDCWKWLFGFHYGDLMPNPDDMVVKTPSERFILLQEWKRKISILEIMVEVDRQWED